MKNHVVIFTALTFCFLSCQNEANDTIRPTIDYQSLIPCPAETANSALDFATEYSQNVTEYELGGQDMLRSIKLDCSGLIVNCYKYATYQTEYTLPFTDAAVINFFEKYTIKTNVPRPGDILFMGDNRNQPTHMGFFVRDDNEYIYFIDSTYKPEEGINGVSERFYHREDKRFLSFGVLLLGML